jgi:hypothetical protein
MMITGSITPPPTSRRNGRMTSGKIKKIFPKLKKVLDKCPDRCYNKSRRKRKGDKKK